MRSKGLFEISSALCGSRAIKVVGRASAGLRYKALSEEELSLNLLDFGTGGMSWFEKFEKGEVDVGWINPAAPLTMAAKGIGPFNHPIPVATIATFPSWDRMVFAISKNIGVESLAELKEKQYPLKVSVFAGRGDAPGKMYKDWATIFAIEEVLKFHGFSLKDIEKWGGSVQVVSAPRDHRRLEAIDKLTIDAVFDEGIQAWGPAALAKGMKFVDLDEGAIERMKQFGFRRGLVRKSSILGLDQDVVSLDFSGWPIFVHPDMSEIVAYQLCVAIEARRGSIPVDQEEALEMGQLCRDSEACPLDVPLHPGAERFYRDRGYLS
jgi:TRAP-type uncharacterized transport system substrate-binding protein